MTNTKKLEGLGGWLIVVAIGLFVTFFWLVIKFMIY